MSYADEILLVGNISWSFNITDPQNWTSITVIAENQCRSVSVPVNFTACTLLWSYICLLFVIDTVVCPNTEAATTTTRPTGEPTHYSV